MNQLEYDTCKLLDYNHHDASSRFISYVLRSLARIIKARSMTFKSNTRRIQFEAQASSLVKMAQFFEQTWVE